MIISFIFFLLIVLAFFLATRKTATVRILLSDSAEEAQDKIDSLPKTMRFGDKICIKLEEGHHSWDEDVYIRGFRKCKINLIGEGEGASLNYIKIYDDTKVSGLPEEKIIRKKNS